MLRPTHLLPTCSSLRAPILQAARARDEGEVIERWREEAGRGGRAASGWSETLEAASDERIEVLLYAENADQEAWQCPACGRLAADGGQCPLDGTEMDRRDDGLDLAVHQTVAHGGTVWAITAHAISIQWRVSARSCDTRRRKWPLSRARFSKSTSTGGELVPGQEIAISIDQTLVQDATGTMAMMQFELFGHDRGRGRDARSSTSTTTSSRSTSRTRTTTGSSRRWRRKYGVWFSRPGNGICHYIHCERFATPGKTLIGADSHTTQSGSLGMIAIGAGGLDVAVVHGRPPVRAAVPEDRRRLPRERARSGPGSRRRT